MEQGCDEYVVEAVDASLKEKRRDDGEVGDDDDCEICAEDVVVPQGACVPSECCVKEAEVYTSEQHEDGDDGGYII